jgi:hypothetical protein
MTPPLPADELRQVILASRTMLGMGTLLDSRGSCFDCVAGCIRQFAREQCAVARRHVRPGFLTWAPAEAAQFAES